jgi:hypothetical protein
VDKNLIASRDDNKRVYTAETIGDDLRGVCVPYSAIADGFFEIVRTQNRQRRKQAWLVDRWSSEVSQMAFLQLPPAAARHNRGAVLDRKASVFYEFT